MRWWCGFAVAFAAALGSSIADCGGAAADDISESATMVADARQRAGAGRLEGRVTLRCADAAAGCVEQPYPMALILRGPQDRVRSQPIAVSPAGAFAISVMPGAYTIISGDLRGSCCLPVLAPIRVTVSAGHTVRVQVRFSPGLRLPTR